MESFEFLRVLRGQFLARLVAEDALMFRAVILVGTADIRRQGGEEKIADEYQYLYNSLDEIFKPAEAGTGYRVQPLGRDGGQEGEEEKGERKAEDGGYRHNNAEHLAAQVLIYPLFKLRFRLGIVYTEIFRGDGQRFVAENKRLDHIDYTADNRDIEKFMFFAQRHSLAGSYLDTSVFQAGRDGVSGLAFHHNPFDKGLTADGAESAVFFFLFFHVFFLCKKCEKTVYIYYNI